MGEASDSLFVSPASSSTMSDESMASTDVMVGDTGKFVHDFVRKFRGNSLSIDALASIAVGPHAEIIFGAEPSKIWVAPIAGMSREDFSLMRFWSTSLEEFGNLALCGSLNEIMQVHATLSQRKELQRAQMAPVFLAAFGKHPGECLLEKWNPEAGSLDNMYKVLTLRTLSYMLDTKPKDRKDRKVPSSPCQSYSKCDNDHRVALAMVAKKACCIQTSPTVWQKTEDEENEIKKNMQQFFGKYPCSIYENHIRDSLDK